MVSLMASQTMAWSDLATIPERRAMSVLVPLIGSGTLSNLNGRSGDLIIVQFKSAEHETASRRASIRSLGLRGVNSASLRNSSDPTIRGYINTVRDLIGVIELDEVKWKAAIVDGSDPAVSYEYIGYGTNTRPGAVVHNTLGDYFVFESTRNDLVVTWTTNLSPADCVRELMAHFESFTPRAGDASVLALSAKPVTGNSKDSEGGGGDPVDDSLDILDVPTDEAMRIVRSQAEDLAFVRLAFKPFDMLWHEPYVRFLGDDEELAEVGLILYDFSCLPAARAFARATANRGFFKGRVFEVMVREHGNPKRLKF